MPSVDLVASVALGWRGKFVGGKLLQ